MTMIDWGALRPRDIGAAATEGYNAGRLQAKQRATQDILAGYGSNPSAGVPAELWSLDPNTAATLSQNDRQRVVAERQAQDALRTTRARETYSTALREQMPNALPSLAGTPTGAPDALAPVSDPNEIVVQARPRAVPAPRTVSIADIAADSPELAQQFSTHLASLSKEHREDLSSHFGMGASVAAGALQYPDEESRRAFIDSHRPELRMYGYTDDQIDSTDTSDRGLMGFIAVGEGADKFLDNLRQKEAAEEAKRHNRVGEGQSSARLGLARRADGRAAVRFKERDKDRAALSGNFGVDTDISDLDY